MVSLVFLPIDSCDDGGGNWPSSFGQAVQVFRFRAGRLSPTYPAMQFERVFIGLYDTTNENFGDVGFFDVAEAPPKTGRPKSLMRMSEVVGEIISTYNLRNSPPFEWADTHEIEILTTPPIEADDDEEG
jgi:hypothetical protein